MSGFVVTHRSVIAPEQLDHLGHLNVQHHAAALSDGGFGLMTEMGLGPRAMEERRIGLAAVNMEIRFHSEVLAGVIVVLESAIGRLEDRKVLFLHRLWDRENGEICMTGRVLGVVMDLDARRSCVLPDDLRAAAEAFLVDENALDSVN